MTFGGCKKDNVEKSNFTFNEDTYFIKHCGILNKGATEHDPATYEYAIVFSDSPITYNDILETITSDGSSVEITLYSTSESELLSGSYTYDRFQSMDDLTCYHGFIGLFGFESGIIDLYRRGNSFKFEFEFYIEGDLPVIGYYNGPIEKFSLPAATK